MSSPFSTIEEFNNVLEGPTEGAIYTFANTPAINAIALLVAVGIFIWFMVATYTTHAESPTGIDQSLNRLSTFIVVGLISAIAAIEHNARPTHTEQSTFLNKPALSRGYQKASDKLPLGLLGMMSIGLPKLHRRAKRRERQKQRSKFLRK